MPMNSARGNMYPWVSHTHAHLGGECGHRCSYCYVSDLVPKRFRKPGMPGRPASFAGETRLIPGALNVRYGSGNTIFVDHCNDLWAEDVKDAWIMAVLDHCAQWPDNTFVYQTKNPYRFEKFLAYTLPTCLLGCTIETNRDIAPSVSVAPPPRARFEALKRLRGVRRLFVTVEPILDCDVSELVQWLVEIGPEFVNVGADSKGHGLPEPSAEKVLALIDMLSAANIEVRGKHNLGRIVGKGTIL